MGVARFYRWLSERYPLINETIDTEQVGCQYDNLYLDMNGIIHNCSHGNDAPDCAWEGEEELWSHICAYINRIVCLIRPRKLVYFAVDGVAPRAKINQQRTRRFRAARERLAQEKRSAAYGAALAVEEERSTAPKHGRVPRRTPPFDSNTVTPGTAFMTRLTEVLHYFVELMLHSSNPDCGGSVTPWTGLKVIVSGPDVCGEGEHKIMDFIRRNYVQKREKLAAGKLTSENATAVPTSVTTHCLYGLDADLIMLGLLSHEPHFSLLREPRQFARMSAPDAEIGRGTGSERTDACELLHLGLLREFIELDLLKTVKREDDLPPEAIAINATHENSSPVGRNKNTKSADVCSAKPSAEIEVLLLSSFWDLDRVIDDFILFSFLAGNDFLPHLPLTDIGEGGLHKLMAVYRIHLLSAAYEALCKLCAESKLSVPKTAAEFQSIVQGAAFEPLRHLTPWISDGKGNILWKPFHRFLQRWAAVERRCILSAMKERNLVKGGNTKSSFLAAGAAAAAAASGGSKSGSGAKPGSTAKSVPAAKSGSPASGSPAGSSPGGGASSAAAPVLPIISAYYERKLKLSKGDSAGLSALLTEYLRGLQWCLSYYYKGTPSWEWYYPRHYSPYVNSLIDFAPLADGTFSVAFAPSQPFTPFQQLLAVLPRASASLLPPLYAPLLISPSSPIADFYPDDFEVDMEGVKVPWGGATLLPFVDEKRLFDAMKGALLGAAAKPLTPAEVRRNVRGKPFLYFVKQGGGANAAAASPAAAAESAPRRSSALVPYFPDIERSSVTIVDFSAGVLGVFGDHATAVAAGAAGGQFTGKAADSRAGGAAGGGSVHPNGHTGGHAEVCDGREPLCETANGSTGNATSEETSQTTHEAARLGRENGKPGKDEPEAADAGTAAQLGTGKMDAELGSAAGAALVARKSATALGNAAIAAALGFPSLAQLRVSITYFGRNLFVFEKMEGKLPGLHLELEGVFEETINEMAIAGAGGDRGRALRAVADAVAHFRALLTVPCATCDYPLRRPARIAAIHTPTLRFRVVATDGAAVAGAGGGAGGGVARPPFLVLSRRKAGRKTGAGGAPSNSSFDAVLQQLAAAATERGMHFPAWTTTGEASSDLMQRCFLEGLGFDGAAPDVAEAVGGTRLRISTDYVAGSCAAQGGGRRGVLRRAPAVEVDLAELRVPIHRMYVEVLPVEDVQHPLGPTDGAHARRCRIRFANAVSEKKRLLPLMLLDRELINHRLDNTQRLSIKKRPGGKPTEFFPGARVGMHVMCVNRFHPLMGAVGTVVELIENALGEPAPPAAASAAAAPGGNRARAGSSGSISTPAAPPPVRAMRVVFAVEKSLPVAELHERQYTLQQQLHALNLDGSGKSLEWFTVDQVARKLKLRTSIVSRLKGSVYVTAEDRSRHDIGMKFVVHAKGSRELLFVPNFSAPAAESGARDVLLSELAVNYFALYAERWPTVVKAIELHAKSATKGGGGAGGAGGGAPGAAGTAAAGTAAAGTAAAAAAAGAVAAASSGGKGKGRPPTSASAALKASALFPGIDSAVALKELARWCASQPFSTLGFTAAGGELLTAGDVARIDRLVAGGAAGEAAGAAAPATAAGGAKTPPAPSATSAAALMHLSLTTTSVLDAWPVEQLSGLPEELSIDSAGCRYGGSPVLLGQRVCYAKWSCMFPLGAPATVVGVLIDPRTAEAVFAVLFDHPHLNATTLGSVCPKFRGAVLPGSALLPLAPELTPWGVKPASLRGFARHLAPAYAALQLLPPPAAAAAGRCFPLRQTLPQGAAVALLDHPEAAAGDRSTDPSKNHAKTHSNNHLNQRRANQQQHAQQQHAQHQQAPQTAQYRNFDATRQPGPPLYYRPAGGATASFEGGRGAAAAAAAAVARPTDRKRRSHSNNARAQSPASGGLRGRGKQAPPQGTPPLSPTVARPPGVMRISHGAGESGPGLPRPPPPAGAARPQFAASNSGAQLLAVLQQGSAKPAGFGPGPIFDPNFGNIGRLPVGSFGPGPAASGPGPLRAAPGTATVATSALNYGLPSAGTPGVSGGAPEKKLCDALSHDEFRRMRLAELAREGRVLPQPRFTQVPRTQDVSASRAGISAGDSGPVSGPNRAGSGPSHAGLRPGVGGPQAAATGPGPMGTGPGPEVAAARREYPPPGAAFARPAIRPPVFAALGVGARDAPGPNTSLRAPAAPVQVPYNTLQPRDLMNFFASAGTSVGVPEAAAAASAPATPAPPTWLAGPASAAPAVPPVAPFMSPGSTDRSTGRSNAAASRSAAERSSSAALSFLDKTGLSFIAEGVQDSRVRAGSASRRRRRSRGRSVASGGVPHAGPADQASLRPVGVLGQRRPPRPPAREQIGVSAHAAVGYAATPPGAPARPLTYSTGTVTAAAPAGVPHASAAAGGYGTRTGHLPPPPALAARHAPPAAAAAYAPHFSPRRPPGKAFRPSKHQAAGP